MVPRDYRYRCFDDCTQVSLYSRPRAKSFFIQDTRVNLYVRNTLRETSGANSIKYAARADTDCGKQDASIVLYITLL